MELNDENIIETLLVKYGVAYAAGDCCCFMTLVSGIDIN